MTQRLSRNAELVLLTVAAFQDREGGPVHGYPLARVLEALDKPLAINYATLYRSLLRLEEKGYLTSTTAERGLRRGRPRRSFELTDLGRQVIEATNSVVALNDDGTVDVTLA